MSEMWVIYNPGSSAVGMGDPRINPQRKLDMQIEGNSFIIVGQEEIDAWNQFPAFQQMVSEGILVIEKTDKMPKPKLSLPERLKTRNQYDNHVAQEIALSPQQDVQLLRINLFKSENNETDWREDADITYLRNRHRPILNAAEWWLTVFVEKPSADQRKRLTAIRSQLKAINRLG